MKPALGRETRAARITLLGVHSDRRLASSPVDVAPLRSGAFTVAAMPADARDAVPGEIETLVRAIARATG